MEDPPWMTIVAGPNGSGKTTITRKLAASGLDLGVYVNADDIALALPMGPERDRNAQAAAERLRADCFKARQSFTFETVMSHPSKVDEMREARRAGFMVRLIFVALENPQMNVDRVALRVTRGGHDVPTDRIISRYQRTLAFLPSAMISCDRAAIFDNSDPANGHRLVGTLAASRRPDREARHEDAETSAGIALSIKGECLWFARALAAPDSGFRDLCRRRKIFLNESRAA